jgi:hypothetical protein
MLPWIELAFHFPVTTLRLCPDAEPGAGATPLSAWTQVYSRARRRFLHVTGTVSQM